MLHYVHLAGMVACNQHTCGCIFKLPRETFCLVKNTLIAASILIMFGFECVGEGKSGISKCHNEPTEAPLHFGHNKGLMPLRVLLLC